MRKPIPPPDTNDIFSSANASRMLEVLKFASSSTIDDEYLYWDKLLRRTPPAGLTHNEWWWGLKLHRRAGRKSITLRSTSGERFWFTLADPIPSILHEIDLHAGGTIQMPEQITNPALKDRYYVSSLIEEAITSSQMEGAVTTRQVAKDMIRSGRKPSNRSERMILNNFITMRRLAEWKGRPLTNDLVFEIHRLITEDTLANPSAAGRMRLNDESEKVVVDDMYGEVYHNPPPAAQLPARLKAMCDFANGKTPEFFVHPVLRSIILHFWLAYDHPFLDGNGRTARALFYWSMLHHNYWLFEFISISPIILKAPSRYQLAFLHTETDECDLTYFMLYHLDVIQRAIRQLHAYIKRKSEQVHVLEMSLRGVATLNHRQHALISHALRHPHQTYTIESHRLSHNIVYETARRDLHELVQRNLLNSVKVGREWFFTPVKNLEEQLSRLS
jgi:Fic family protein